MCRQVVIDTPVSAVLMLATYPCWLTACACQHKKAASRGTVLRLYGKYRPLRSFKLQGRLKSLYSIHKKMQRKNVGLAEIYDARALRVVIDDGGDRQNEEAIIACYQVRPQRIMQCCCLHQKSQQRSVTLHLLTPASDVC